MKKIIFLFLLFAYSSIEINANQATLEDSCIIYIYRVGQYAGAGANWAMFVDETKLCKLSNNKFMRVVVKPGKHVVSSRVGGVGLFKKETELELETEAGGEYYVACNIKQSFTRVRMEMIEVTKGSGKKQMEKMTLDKCQEQIDNKEE
jgi:Protein of unknown function (DUF2846)